MTIRRVSIFGLVMVALVASCATKPPAAPEPEPVVVAPVKPEPTPEPAPKAPEISREELAALHNRVVALRKDAFELGLKESMAAEYSAADAKYIAGKTALDADDRPKAKAELTAAEPLFADLVTKGGAMVAKQRQQDAGAARNRALKADAAIYSPDSLAMADSMLAKADALLGAGDSKAAIQAYAVAMTAYDAVEKRSKAVTVRDQVDSLDFGPMDSGNYATAGQKLDSIEGLIANEPDKAQDNAAEALLRYNLVLGKGWELTAGSRRDDAGRYKSDSESIKAQVAVKDDYAEAQSLWEVAVAVFASGDHEAAALLFGQGEGLFQAVYEKTLTKKEAADAAMKAANASTERSANIAASGDKLLNSGEGE